MVFFTSTPEKFFGTFSLIGIFSGLYQFYLKNYKEKMSDKTTKALGNYIANYVKKVSLWDFLTILGEEGNNLEKVRRLLYLEKNRGVPDGSFRGNFYVVQVPTYFDSSGFFHIEDFIKFKENPSITQKDLNKLYEKYFDLKFEDFKKKLRSEDLGQIKKVILSSIIFFDEVLATINKLNLQDPKSKKEDPEDKEKHFIDYYENFQQDCMNYVVNLILNKKEVKKEK